MFLEGSSKGMLSPLKTTSTKCSSLWALLAAPWLRRCSPLELQTRTTSRMFIKRRDKLVAVSLGSAHLLCNLLTKARHASDFPGFKKQQLPLLGYCKALESGVHGRRRCSTSFSKLSRIVSPPQQSISSRGDGDREILRLDNKVFLSSSKCHTTSSMWLNTIWKMLYTRYLFLSAYRNWRWNYSYYELKWFKCMVLITIERNVI